MGGGRGMMSRLVERSLRTSAEADGACGVGRW